MPAESGDRNAVLSDRRDIVVIADEAHRSQYDFIDGFARHMRDALPQASGQTERHSLMKWNARRTWADPCGRHGAESGSGY
jgi:SWI2/SNF2 ATPase